MPSCQQIQGQTVRNELISKGVPYQLKSKCHDTIEGSFSFLPKGGQNDIVWIWGASTYSCLKHVAN